MPVMPKKCPNCSGVVQVAEYRDRMPGELIAVATCLGCGLTVQSVQPPDGPTIHVVKPKPPPGVAAGSSPTANPAAPQAFGSDVPLPTAEIE